MAASIAPLVERALRAAGIPIDSVSIGDPADRATWRVTFAASATPAQQASAPAIVAAVAVDAAAQNAQDQRDAQALVDAASILTKAIVLALLDEINLLRAALPTPLGPRTPAQAIAAIRAKAATL